MKFIHNFALKESFILINALLYYCFVLPMAYLPMVVIYGIGGFFFLVIYYIIPYRKKVVMQNIQNSFPALSNKEHQQITRKFYRYLTRLIAESIKNLVISESALKKRLKVKNPEVMDALYAQGKHVLLLSSHYNNWELLITAQNLLFKHQAIGIGTPLSNKFWDKKINARRARFGMHVVHANNYKEVLADYKETPTATLILGDQSPGKNENCYWTDFLNQETAFFFGAEILANQMDAAVVYGAIRQQKRGYYELELKTISENPKVEPYGKITEDYIRLLENDIRQEPYAWLWSHKRWKKGIPDNLVEIKENHKKRFVERFRPEPVKAEG